LLTSCSNPDWDNIPLEALEKAIGLATACAQSNARTLRPGLLEASFMASL